MTVPCIACNIGKKTSSGYHEEEYREVCEVFAEDYLQYTDRRGHEQDFCAEFSLVSDSTHRENRQKEYEVENYVVEYLGECELEYRAFEVAERRVEHIGEQEHEQCRDDIRKGRIEEGLELLFINRKHYFSSSFSSSSGSSSSPGAHLPFLVKQVLQDRSLRSGCL